MKRLLVTGSRHWTDRQEITDALNEAWRELADFTGDVMLVHGAARGADRIAAEAWTAWGLSVEPHPADWYAPCRPECKPNHRRAKSGMYRNAEMVALGADLCLAFILDNSAGATGCARLARKAGIPVRTFRASSAVSL